MNKAAILATLFLAAGLSAVGQKITPSPADLYTDALEYMDAGDYSEALYVLRTLEDKGYITANVSYRIGECYLNLPGLKKYAIPYLNVAAQNISMQYSGKTLDEAFSPVKSLLYLGVAYRINYQFREARACFEEYYHSVDDVEIEEKALAAYHIERCNNALELMAAPAKFSADTLPDPINSQVSNFNPLVTSDEKGLYFMNQLKFYDAVMRAEQTDASWQPPENITPAIKSDGDHYITGISADGSSILLTAYDPFRSGELYTATLKDGQWGEMIKLNDAINTLFNETHASFSQDGKQLYFTSDRIGGFGGLDIYRSSLTPAGDWGAPVNLGPLINSPYNEETPFISTDSRKLFFSSQGHYNMGGYDVFYSALDENGVWLPPVNIGYPLNSTDDDVFFFPVDTGNIAYRSDFSQQAVQRDIVRYTISAFGKPARFTVLGKVDLEGDAQYDPGKIAVTFTASGSNDTLAVVQLKQDGSFQQKLAAGSYRIVFSDPEKSLLSRQLSIPEYYPNNQLVMLAELTVAPSLKNDTLLLQNILFDFDRSLIAGAYQEVLNGIGMAMVKYPGLRLQINGYTDSKGNDAYNLKLSLLRAKAVEAYLLSHADIADRIAVQGFGETHPVAINSNADGTDNPLGRSYNRRVELILKEIPEELIIIPIADIPRQLMHP